MFKIITLSPEPAPLKIIDPPTLTDAELYQLCRQYGQETLLARRKFLGLLPEVARRKLYELKGYSSITVFAAKLAGVSEEQVRLALNLEAKFKDKPLLHLKLTSGEISINKLARIASVATAENAEFWATQAQNLPQSTLETLVRDERLLQNKSLRAHSNPSQLPQKSIFTDDLTAPVPPLEISQLSQLQLSPENLNRLLTLQNKGIDINDFLTVAFDQREQAIAEEKANLASQQQSSPAKSSRYIPVAIQRLLTKEYGTKCAVPTCNKLSTELHHKAHFALVQNHDPYLITPLCEDHHKIAHLLNQNYRQYLQYR